jgi:hypothetical protein
MLAAEIRAWWHLLLQGRTSRSCNNNLTRVFPLIKSAPNFLVIYDARNPTKIGAAGAIGGAFAGRQKEVANTQ